MTPVSWLMCSLTPVVGHLAEEGLLTGPSAIAQGAPAVPVGMALRRREC